MEGDQQFIAIWAEGIGARVVAAGLRSNVLHFFRLTDQLAHVIGNFGRFGQGRPRRQIGANPNDALIELRQELRTERRPKSKCAGNNREG